MTDPSPTNIGARLRVCREQAGLTLRQIADTTKLTVHSLELLERGRVAQLPGGLYRRAIVRAYAREIGLDPEETLRAFLAQHPDDLPAPPVKVARTDSWGKAITPQEPSTPVRPRMWRMALSLLGALIPIVAGILYFASAGGADASRALADVLPPRVEPWQPEIVPASTSADASLAAARAVSLMISVSAHTDMQVIADGREVLRRRMEAGEQVQLELADDVVLFGDNAAAVQFSINGRAGRLLGDPGTPLNVRIGREDYEDWLVHP